jgi:hypothetical protein
LIIPVALHSILWDFAEAPDSTAIDMKSVKTIAHEMSINKRVMI